MLSIETSKQLKQKRLPYFVKDELMIGYDIPQMDHSLIEDDVAQMSAQIKSLFQRPGMTIRQMTPLRLTRYRDDIPTSTLVVFVVQLYPTGLNGQNFLDQIAALEDRLIELQQDRSSGQEQLRFVMPNWVTRSAAPSIGGGLAMAPQPIIDNSRNPVFPRFNLPQWAEQAVPASGAVKVFILDTLRDIDTPSGAPDGERTIRQWVAQKAYPLSTNYEEGATAADAFESVESSQKIPRMGTMLVADHGLFTAGIVSALTNNVSITGLAALNEWGIGNMASLYASMVVVDQFVKDNPTTPVIVNCGLTIYVPADAEQVELERRAYAYEDDRRYGVHVTDEDEEYSSSLTEQLYKRMQDSLFTWSQTSVYGTLPSSVVVIAAAGNDGFDAKRYGIGVLGPRYPARFNQVIGVSAIDKEGKRATYSNRSDVPNDKDDVDVNSVSEVALRGFTTIGSLKSLYMGILPSKTRPVTGLAQWKGTSFSAAVVTGLLARLLQADAIPLASAKTRLDNALKTMSTGNSLHPSAGGYVLEVTQG